MPHSPNGQTTLSPATTIPISTDPSSLQTRGDVARARLAAIVRSSGDAIIGESLEGIITDWNPAAEHLYGYSAEEVIGQPFMTLIPPDRAAESVATLARVLRGEHVEGVETYRWTKDGRRIEVSIAVSAVWNDAGEMIATSAIVRDITARKAAEAEQTETHQHTRQVLERITDGFYALDREWCFTYVNEAAEVMLGRTRQELLGQNVWVAFPEAVENPVYASHRKAMVEGITTTVEFFFAPLDTWFESRAYPSPDGLSVFFRDVTASRQQVDALRESHEGLQAVVDHVPAVIYILAADEAQTALYFSPRIEALTGYRPEEALMRPAGGHWLGPVHPDDRARVAAEDARAISTGEPFRIEYQYLRKDGSYVWVLDECIPVHDATGQIIAWHGVLLDISERVQAEEERAHLASIVESAEDGILSCSLDGIITSWNHGAEKLYGYRIDEVIGRDVAMLRPPELADDIAEFMAGVRHGKSIEGHETERVTKDGRRIRVSLSISPIRDVNGRIVGIASISRDITALRQAEAALRLRDRALAAATNGILITDATLPGNPIVDVNPAFERLTGYQRSEVLGRNCRFLQGPDTDPETVGRLREAIAAGRDVTETLLNYRQDATPFWNDLHIAAVRDDAGHLTHFVGIQTNVSEHIAAEAALRESEARFRGVWENTRDAMSLTNQEGILLAINPAHTDLYGFSSDAIVGRHFSIIYPEAERTALETANRELFAQAVLPPTFESTIQQGDGDLRETEIRMSFIEVGGERTMTVSAIRDVTERKRMERDLREALHGAQVAAHTKSQFLAMMSHELRTPLQAVLGYTDFLLLGPEEVLTAEQREDLGYIHGGAIRMMALIDQLLDLSRLEAGRLDLVRELVDLPEIIEQVRQDIAPQVGAKGLELHIDLPPALPLVLGDAGRLRQVLLNLAGNAMKFTHQGTVSISARPSDTGVAIAVRDTGIGITAEALPMVFEEFRQVDSNMTRRYGGAGLGLAIAKRLVEQMGGSITVESRLGHGSTFTVRLGLDPRIPQERAAR